MLTGATRKVDIPHEPGEWVELRYLSWRDTARIRREAADDEETLGAMWLTAAITAWSYEAPVSPETIDRLDDVTVVFIMGELAPTLRTEEERKNGSSPSTSPSTEKETPALTGGSRASSKKG